MKWLTYSGLCVILSLNPLHWRFIPWMRRDVKEWAGPREWTGSIGFLFLTIRIWIDDGSW